MNQLPRSFIMLAEFSSMMPLDWCPYLLAAQWGEEGLFQPLETSHIPWFFTLVCCLKRSRSRPHTSNYCLFYHISVTLLLSFFLCFFFFNWHTENYINIQFDKMEISVHLWNRHHNLCHKPIHHLQVSFSLLILYLPPLLLKAHVITLDTPIQSSISSYFKISWCCYC